MYLLFILKLLINNKFYVLWQIQFISINSYNISKETQTFAFIESCKAFITILIIIILKFSFLIVNNQIRHESASASRLKKSGF